MIEPGITPAGNCGGTGPAVRPGSAGPRIPHLLECRLRPDQLPHGDRDRLRPEPGPRALWLTLIPGCSGSGHFNVNGEEQNLDAAVTIILDDSGNDITNRPKPPFAIRSFATAGGSIRVEWAYNTINPRPIPTGFHVYLGTPPLLVPTAQICAASVRTAGSVRAGGGSLAR